MRRSWGVVATVAWLLIPGAADAWAAEEVAEDGVPEQVQRTVRAVAPAGRPLEFRRVGDTWVTSVLVDDHREELAIEGDGTWRGRARRVSLSAAPAEVRDTVRHRYARSSVWRVDLHQYPVGDVYVVYASHADERVEACVAADGTLLGERVLAEGEV